jgi:hypothetical protein
MLRSGLWRQFAGKLAVHGVGREVGAVRPADRAELVNRHLTEYRLVAQRLENLAVKLAGQVYHACNTVVELNVQPVFRERDDLYDTGHHLPYSNGLTLLIGLPCCASVQLFLSSL